MSENRLSRETSPYLLQHKDNPVHWWAFGPDAFAEARATGKPILLSVGYAACHWCHVMAHESFEDPQVAGLMNALFVNIKVDREERPDVDQIYMAALQQLGQSGGWPLTMFLDPQGRPFWGGTYFPPVTSYGRPAFSEVLQQVSTVFTENPDKVEKNANTILTRLKKAAEPVAGVAIGQEDLDGAAARTAELFDPVHGGLKGAPKFPQSGLMELLWRVGTRRRDDKLKAMVALTLNRMSEGGIYDHLGGGFARYSVDEIWFVPHFEKMLYDNAQLLDLLALAHRDTGDGLFLRRAREIVGWLEREMLTPEGAFAASLDADSEGHEGRFYVWTAREIEAVLGAEDAAFFNRFYDVTPAGNWEAGNILNRTDAGFVSAEAEARLEPLREKLLAAREHRVRPGRDDKVLADWNGLMIAALARTGAFLGEAAWVALAQRAFDTVCARMITGGRLAHSWCGDKLVAPGLASDLAAMARAGLALHEATGAGEGLERAAGFLEALEAHHLDPATGTYFLTADDADSLVVRPRITHDEAVPNSSAVAAEALVRLSALTGNDALRARADRILSGLSGPAAKNALAHGAALNAIDTRLNLAQIVVVGARSGALATAALEVPFPLRVLVRADEGSSALAGSVMAARIASAPAEGAAFVCIGERCSLPVTDPGRLPKAVAEMLA
ncbi:thioredoxin domain-containing protein [Xanthobacter dioxanivorans]|uniref:Thioredoxin domain-containing protein n=1 Tax=Xanthobacter dioxanivorans TaxID=2528964 RepID=A0A974PRL8_9HYPH|nr:thioredoxin domain-containing protein [Xanthobacter dioxanivorans]QRG08196.1 thioredoxin domain-containing protein [Xanthobacter dioxanivorans]